MEDVYVCVCDLRSSPPTLGIVAHLASTSHQFLSTHEITPHDMRAIKYLIAGVRVNVFVRECVCARENLPYGWYDE